MKLFSTSGFLSVDNDSFLQEFIFESERLIGDALKIIERFYEDLTDREKIHSLFRSIHSIKGVAGFVKQDEIKEVAHNFENVLDDIRSNKIEITMNRARLIEVIFKKIRQLIQECENKNDSFLNNYKSILRLIGILQTGEISDKDLDMAAAQFIPFVKKMDGALVSKLYDLRRKIIEGVTAVGEVRQLIPQIEEILKKIVEYSEDSNYKIFNLANSLQTFLKHLALTDENHVQPCTVLAKNLELLNSLISLEFMGIKNMSLETAQYIQMMKSEIDASNSPFSGNIVIPSSDNSMLFKQFNNQSFTVRVGPEKLTELNDLINDITYCRDIMIKFLDDHGDEGFMQAHLPELTNVTDKLSFTEKSLRTYYFDIKKVPLMALYQRLDALIVQLSEQLGKKIGFERVGESILISHNKLEILKESLFHIIRNACDHGIEPSGERLAAGKTEVGTINIGAEENEDGLVICIKDDGRGIRVNNIKRKILEAKLATEQEIKAKSDRELLEYLFKPGVTTSDKVTEISGRGVGLDVVKSNLSRLKGTVKIDSKPGEYTEFTIVIPN